MDADCGGAEASVSSPTNSQIILSFSDANAVAQAKEKEISCLPEYKCFGVLALNARNHPNQQKRQCSVRKAGLD